MKDFLKQDLNVGDKIIACASHGRNSGASFVHGVIIRFTEKTVVYKGPDYTGAAYTNYERRIDPSKVIKRQEIISELIL